MALKAAVGSSKNITPSWLTARSKGSPSQRSVCTSMTTKSTLSTPARRARSRASSRSGAEMSSPLTRPPGATWPASAMLRAPPPHPMSHTRWPGPAAAAESTYAERASVSRSRSGHTATQRSSFHRVNSFSLATATT